MNKKRKLKMCDWNAIHDEINSLYSKENCTQKHNRFFHYTTPEALLSIFKDYIDSGFPNNVTSCSMRASNLRFLNDAQEYKDGVQWIQTNLDESKVNLYSQIYSISFCGQGDLLSQWKWYGKNSGVAIEFNPNNIQYEYWCCRDKALPSTDSQTKPLLIKYTDDEKSQYYKDIKALNEERKLNEDSDSIIGNLLVPFCKDKGFSEEKESRLVFYTFDSSEYGIDFKMQYYASNGVIKPTLNVNFLSCDGKNNIVNSFIVGPGQNQNLIFNALVHIFDRNNFNFCETETTHLCENGIIISKSSIPFRG